MIGSVRPMVRARSRAGFSGLTSWSRRRWSWATACSIHPDAPGNSPTFSSTTSGGIDTAPMPARGIGMSEGRATHGAPQSSASDASCPPEESTTIRAPLAAACVAASTTSSVLPENEMAKQSVPSPTNEGHS